MNHLHDGRHCALVKAERVGIGDHDGRNVVARRIERAGEVGGIDDTGRTAGKRHGRKSIERAARGIGPVGRVGNEDFARRAPLRAVVGADHHEPGELALRTGRGLQGDAIHARDLGEHALEAVDHLERALRIGVGGQRVQPRKTREPGRPLVDLRVVFHRARPERIKLRVDRKVPLREPNEVPKGLGLAHFGERSRRFAGELAEDRGRVDRGNVEQRERRARASRCSALENGGLAELDAACGLVRHRILWDETTSNPCWDRRVRPSRRCSSDRG